jgi:hypothetical protein
MRPQGMEKAAIRVEFNPVISDLRTNGYNVDLTDCDASALQL